MKIFCKKVHREANVFNCALFGGAGPPNFPAPDFQIDACNHLTPDQMFKFVLHSNVRFASGTTKCFGFSDRDSIVCVVVGSTLSTARCFGAPACQTSGRPVRQRPRRPASKQIQEPRREMNLSYQQAMGGSYISYM